MANRFTGLLMQFWRGLWRMAEAKSHTTNRAINGLVVCVYLFCLIVLPVLLPLMAREGRKAILPALMCACVWLLLVWLSFRFGRSPPTKRSDIQ